MEAENEKNNQNNQAGLPHPATAPAFMWYVLVEQGGLLRRLNVRGRFRVLCHSALCVAGGMAALADRAELKQRA